MAGQHSAVHRGLVAAGTSPDRGFEGRFGRMFPDTEAASFGATEADEAAALKRLADALVSPFDPPRTGLTPRRAGSHPSTPTWVSSSTTT